MTYLYTIDEPQQGGVKSFNCAFCSHLKVGNLINLHKAAITRSKS